MLDYILEDRLKEWARYVRSPKARAMQCLSVEHRWNSDFWNGWREKDPRSSAVNLERAAQVEAIICHIGRRREDSKFLLVQHYVKFANPRVTCRLLNCRITDYDSVLQSARGMVAALLDSDIMEYEQSLSSSGLRPRSYA